MFKYRKKKYTTGGKLAKKAEVQKKDEHENRNAVIVGFMLAFIPFIISILFLYSRGEFPCSAWWCKVCPEACQPQEPVINGTVRQMTACIGGAFCPSVVFLLGELPKLYLFVYLPLGAVLYLVGLKLDKENRLQLRFWGKSLSAGALFGLALVLCTISLKL
jgi:hypothetical protein